MKTWNGSARRVILLNADYSTLGEITWQKAVTLIVLGEADAVVSDPEQMVRSKSLSIPMPRTVRLRRYAIVEYIPIPVDEHSRVSRSDVLRRDKNRCGYCDDYASTVDHIIPRSLGGADTWGNLIASCEECNFFKADRTPEQAGMKLLWPPKVPVWEKKAQKTVWRQIEGGDHCEYATG